MGLAFPFLINLLSACAGLRILNWLLYSGFTVLCQCYSENIRHVIPSSPNKSHLENSRLTTI